MDSASEAPTASISPFLKAFMAADGSICLSTTLSSSGLSPHHFGFGVKVTSESELLEPTNGPAPHLSE